MQAKSHELPLPQVQVPFAHTAWQLPLFPSQVTWQGGALQTNRQSSPGGQEQVPLRQPPADGTAGGGQHEREGDEEDGEETGSEADAHPNGLLSG